jgi:putative membrane protein
VVVLASGNLGLVSFTHYDNRLTYEDLMEHFPEVVPGLATHPGVSFVMVHTRTNGGLVIGAEGIYDLGRDRASGVNPLAEFGPHAAAHLRRTDGFTNAPDILVMSMYDPTTDEVAAFEELVGSHGGLGGPQTRPFVLYPAEFPEPAEPIVGAAALHDVMKEWLAVREDTAAIEEPANPSS